MFMVIFCNKLSVTMEVKHQEKIINNCPSITIFHDIFPEKYYVTYTLVLNNMYKVNLRNGVHYYCDVLDFNTTTWQLCDDDKISELSGLPDNVYSNLSYQKM